MLKADDSFDLTNSPLGRLAIGLVMGLACTIYGGIEYHKATTLPKHGVEAQGTVVSVRESRSKNSVTHIPKVSFQDDKGQEYQVEMTGTCQVGDQVTVLYLPSHPKTADIKGSLTAMSPIFAFVALGFGLIGWAAVVYNVIFMMRYKRIL